MTMLEAAISRLMQTPNADEMKRLMTSFIGYDPIPDMRIRLRTSAAAFREPKQVGGQTSRQLWTIYNRERNWTGDAAAQVWNRFVKIRHSFAHQDSSVVLLSKNEIAALRDRLSAQRATTPDDIEFVERLNATTALRVLHPTVQPQDPVRDWRIHETHAINSLLAAAGIVASLTDGLADFLVAAGSTARNSFDDLHLDIERGDWVSLAGPTLACSPSSVAWTLVEYRPGSRTP